MAMRGRTVFGAALIFAAACLPARSTESIPGWITKDALFGTILHKTKWDRTTIEVCWQNPQDTTQHYLDLAQEAVHDTWEAASAIRFTGWSKCTSDSAPGIHIQISAGQPHTVSVGKYIDARPSGMFLNFTFTHWRQNCQADVDLCARAAVVHEFGHALGFTHDQKVANSPAECDDEPDDIVGDYIVTEYSNTSIMSLCNPKWNGNGTLSPLDKEAVRTIYGA